MRAALARPGSARLPAVLVASFPNAESGCCRRTSAPVAVRTPRARHAASPNARSGCLRCSFGEPPAAVLAAGEQSAVPHVRERERVPALPDCLLSSVRWSCPEMNRANAAAPGLRKPARPTASGPLRWSEVCQSYSSPEQQCCHATRCNFLENSQAVLTFSARAVPAGGLGRDAARGHALTRQRREDAPWHAETRWAKPDSYTGL